MGLRLKRNESAGNGIRRVARELVDEALDLSEKKTEDAKTPHELRKAFKKIRSVLRLVRDEIGQEVYRRDNVLVRDLGRRLSAVRDAAVREGALEKLQEESRKDVPAADLSAIRSRLQSRRRAERRRLRAEKVLPAVAAGLHELRRSIRTWPLDQSGFPCVEKGLRRAYRRGKKGSAEAYQSKTDEAFHEWRKRAKDLRYHVELLEPAWKDTMSDLEKSLHDLTDLLGDDHDLGDLHRVLTSSPRLTRGAKGISGVLDFILRRRSELQAKARPLARRLYAEKPAAFVKRIEGYWNAWRG